MSYCNSCWTPKFYGNISYDEAANDPEGCASCSEKYCRYDDEDK